MALPFLFSIAGREYKTLLITDYEEFTEILDGAGTGRTQADGWPMVREPQGVIKNIGLEVFIPEDNTNSDYIHLLGQLDSFGKTDFKTVKFITPTGTISQQMYSASYSQKLIRVQENGRSYWDKLSIKFVAKKGISI